VLHLVEEVDARGAPHDDFLGRIALEELDGALAHAAGGGGVPFLVVHDAAAVGRPAHRDVVQAQAIEHGAGGLHHVRGAQHVAAEVEHVLVVLRVLRGRGEPPGALVALRDEVVGERDLAEKALVVVPAALGGGHGLDSSLLAVVLPRPRPLRRARARRAGDPRRSRPYCSPSVDWTTSPRPRCRRQRGVPARGRRALDLSPDHPVVAARVERHTDPRLVSQLRAPDGPPVRPPHRCARCPDLPPRRGSDKV
jgi:hypothetical protein